MTADATTRWDTLAPGQMSPTLSTAQFSSTSSWFPGSVQKHHLGRKDVVRNIRVFENLARMSRQYEDALRGVSEASAQFAEALELVSKVKDLHRPHEDDDTAVDQEDDLVDGFRILSGYQYYMASQQRVLAQLVHEQCTSPLEAQSEAYRNTLTSLHKSYSTKLSEHTLLLKKREKKHASQSRGNNHDFDIYRQGLEDLTHELDAMDQLKYDHYETVAEYTRQVWSSILKRTTMTARAQVDILEKVSDKGLQNDCLGRMIASAGDPFDIPTIDIIDKVERVEIVQRPLTPASEPRKAVSSTAPSGAVVDDIVIIKPPQSESVPTAPSPPVRQTDPFETIDDVPSVHSEVEDLTVQVSQMGLPLIHTDGTITMTPPLTPPALHADRLEMFDEGNKRLLSKLGGYRWRG